MKLLFGAALSFTLCVHGQETAVRARVAHRIKERAYDGKHTITLDIAKVDANSDLLIEFSPLAAVQAAERTARMIQFSNTIHLVTSNMAARAELMRSMRAVSLQDSAAVQKLLQDIETFNRGNPAVVSGWQASLGLAQDEPQWQEIISGHFDNKPNLVQPYANLVRWLTNQLHRLQQEVVRAVESNTVQVTVQAFLQSYGQPLKALHVENYDHIASGEYLPIDRTGLRTTPAEQRVLQLKLQEHEALKESYEELKANGGEVLKAAQATLTKLRDELSKLAQAFQNPADWASRLEEQEGFKTLQKLTDKNDSAKTALTLLQQFQKDWQTVRTFASSIQTVQLSLTAPQATSLSDMLFASKGIVPQLSTMTNDVKSLVNMAGAWPARLQQLVQALGMLVNELPEPNAQSCFQPRSKNSFLRLTPFCQIRAIGCIGSRTSLSKTAKALSALKWPPRLRSTRSGANLRISSRDVSN